MSDPSEFTNVERLANVPVIDDLSFELHRSGAQPDDERADAYLLSRDPQGETSVVAFLDGASGAAHRRVEGSDDALDFEDEPLVKTVGDFSGETGQIVIKQPEGHWRRYSRWDRIEKAPPTQPAAVVRTLPQCGCGGYLGAPMMFDSFGEMLAYFFVVFSDAQAVNEKHAAILNGDACAV